jgi:hypothetical protein
MTISFEEFEELPKLDADKKNLQPGKQYYIQDTRRRVKHLITVYKGTFIEKKGEYNQFSNVEIVVNPFSDVGKPFGFSNKKGFKFMEVIDFNPTESTSSGHSRSSSKSHSRSSSKRRSRSRSSSKTHSSSSKKGGKKTKRHTRR